jgi:signal transduction histidine kinase
MKRHLIFKLLAIHLTVIVFVMVVVWLSIDTLAAGYFVTLMEKYHISPEPAHDMFVSAVHRYLIWAFLAAVFLAVLLSFAMMRRALAPLMHMTAITQEIAAGNFSDRVPVGTSDEMGQLARAFNRMAESLEKIENLRRSLMIDVAHELRTPLTNIRGYLEALDDGVLPPSHETITLLNTETMRLVHLVEEVLDLARADAARGALTLDSINLAENLTGTLALFSRTFEGKGIDVSVKASPEGISVQGDRVRLTRVFRNLLDNAARYTPPGGRVEILMEQDAGGTTVDFLNNTNELAMEDLPYLFERFYRGEKSRSRQHGGAGIGLAMVKELVEAHGGSVSAEMIAQRLRIRIILPPGTPPDADRKSA